MRSAWPWWLCALTLLGLLLRCVGLDHQSGWSDEIYTAMMAAASFDDLVSGRVADPGNPVGYYLLTNLWAQLFDASIPTLRWISALAGALSVPLAWAFARASGLPARWSLAVAGLVAVNPQLVYLSREARVYSLFVTIGLAHLLAAQHLGRVEAQRRRDWLVYGLSAVALLYLHYYAFFVVPIVGAWLLVRSRSSRPGLIRLVACGLLVGLAFAPYLGQLMWQIETGGTVRSPHDWYKHLLLFPGYAVMARAHLLKLEPIPWRIVAHVAVALGVYLPAIYWLWRKRTRPPTLATALVLGVPAAALLFSLYSPLVKTRYLSVILPALALVMVVAFSATPPRSWWRRVMVCVAAFFTLTSLGRFHTRVLHDDWRGLAGVIEAGAAERPIYVYPEHGRFSLGYYLDREMVGLLPGALDDGTALARIRAEGAEGFWLVLYLARPTPRSERFGGDVDRYFSCAHAAGFSPVQLYRCSPRQGP